MDNLRSAWLIMPLGYGCPPVKSVQMAQAYRYSHVKRQHVHASTKGPPTKPCGNGDRTGTSASL